MNNSYAPASFNSSPGLFRSLSTLRLFSMSLDDFRSLPRRRKSSWNPNFLMGPKELTSSQQEFFDSCKRGDLLKVAAYISSKKNKRPKTPLNIFRPATPLAGWLAAIRDPSSHFTPLHAAALNGHDAICKLLIEADPQQATVVDKKECLPLHLASWSGHVDIVQMLVNQSPETVDRTNCAVETSLHLAAQHGHSGVARILLVGRANGYCRNARNELALDIAARTGYHNVCQVLVSYCPELPLQCATDSSHTTEFSGRSPCVYPMHAAAKNSHIQVLRVLREAGFDIDFVAKEGSAMHIACMFGQPEAVMFFIESGINPELRDSDGRTALELLDTLIKRRDSEITQIIQSREGWEDCRKLLCQYVEQWEKANINSSSDSGIDGREYRRQEDSDRDVIWQPLPHNSKNMQMGYHLPTEKNTGDWASKALSTLPRSWNRNMPIPLTHPNYAQKHRSVHRCSNTLPLNMSPQRTTESTKRESILPSSSNIFAPNAVPVLTCKKIEKHGASITYNPTCVYDNVIKEPSPPAADDPAKFNYQSTPLGGSIGRSYGRPIFIKDGTQTLPTTPRQRPSLKATFSPIAEGQSEERKPYESSPLALRSIAEVREDSVGLGNSPCFASRDPNHKESSVAFVCSTLEGSSSPSIADPEPLGRAPLAQPEEMTGSTTTSIMSNSSPEREFRSQSANGASSVFTTSVTVQASDPGHYMGTADSLSLDTVNVSISSLSLDGHNNPPSPNTSQRQIFATLISNADISAKLNADNRKGIISPSITELSDSTVASSCSLPIISQISTSPPSPLSPKKRPSPKKTGGSESMSSEVRLRSGISSQMSNSDYQINEQEEWSQIEGIMSSFGSGICRESVFTTDYEDKVSLYLRDHKTQAITLQHRNVNSGNKDSLSRDEDNMINWLENSVGLSRQMAESIGEILVVNGFDRIGQLHGSLTSEWMNYLNVDCQSQGRILAYLGTVEDRRPKAEEFDYLSDWLCTLELIFYLSNFMEAGFKSVDHFKQAKFGFEDYKNKLKIDLIGHIARLMQSFEQEPVPSAKPPVRSYEPKPIPSQIRQSASYTPIQLKLLTETVNFSAHYLGAAEISNINGTEESRKVMAMLKKEIRDLSDVTQVSMEITVAGITINESKTKKKLYYHTLQTIQIVCQDTRDLNCFAFITLKDGCFYCHVFSVLTADVAAEMINVLKEAFDLAFGISKRQESLDSQ